MLGPSSCMCWGRCPGKTCDMIAVLVGMMDFYNLCPLDTIVPHTAGHGHFYGNIPFSQFIIIA